MCLSQGLPRAVRSSFCARGPSVNSLLLVLNFYYSLWSEAETHQYSGPPAVPDG